jgi:uncharacterized protein DUF1844
MTEEMKIPTSQDMDTVRFFSLITMFASSAYQSMGKIANPMTGKIERNLDSAQGFIDILIMLKTKTNGNLTDDEEKIITSTISDLQMNFVQEKAKPEPEKKEEEKEEEEKREEGDDKSPEEVPPPEDEEEEPKEEAKESSPIITPPPAEDDDDDDDDEKKQ